MAPALAAHPVRVEESIVATCRVQMSIPVPSGASGDVLVASGSPAFEEVTQHDCRRSGLSLPGIHNSHRKNAAAC